MYITEKNDHIDVEGIRDFDLDHILDCGQCFRWEKNSDGSYTGIAWGKVVKVYYDSSAEILHMYGASKEDFENIWYSYFDLDRDYSEIKRKLAAGDEIMARAISYGEGIRILNQEKWETLLSFIISQNNNIPRIKKCINSLAETMGTKAGEFDGTEYYSLPSPEVLAAAEPEDLAPCRLGYRARYLVETARKIVSDGIDSLEALGDDNVAGADAVAALRQYCGVGPKVANCIALFSLGKFDSFPVDVWVRKVMHDLYGIDENDVKAMNAYAAENFGEYGGIAQQYLFYYIRSHASDENPDSAE